MLTSLPISLTQLIDIEKGRITARMERKHFTSNFLILMNMCSGPLVGSTFL